MMLEEYFTPLEHTTSTIGGNLSHVNFRYDDQEFIENCKTIFSTYSGPITNIDSNFMHLHNTEHPELVRKESKKKKDPGKRKRRQKGDGTCFESCIEIRVKSSYKDVNGDLITRTYRIKVFQNGKLSIPGACMTLFDDIRKPLESVRDFLRILLGTPVEIKELSASMLNYKYKLKPDGNRIRQIDVPMACQIFSKLKSNNPLTNTNIILDYLLNNDYSKEGLKYHIVSAQSCVRQLRVNVDELDQLIRQQQIPERKKVLETLQYVLAEDMIINPDIYKQIFKRYLEKFVIELENILKNSVHNLLRKVKYNSDDSSSVIIEFRSPIPKKSGKGVTFKIFDSGKINIAGGVSEESSVYMAKYLNKILADPSNNIIYHDDEESCTSEDSDE